MKVFVVVLVLTVVSLIGRILYLREQRQRWQRIRMPFTKGKRPRL